MLVLDRSAARCLRQSVYSQAEAGVANHFG